MSQFNYFNELNSIFSMDQNKQKLPISRWQRKLNTSTGGGGGGGSGSTAAGGGNAANNSTLMNSSSALNSSKLSVSYNNVMQNNNNNNNNNNGGNSFSISKTTPQKNNVSYSGKNKKTPNSKSPGRKTAITPNNKTTVNTPSGGDRFIPNRSASNFDLAHFLIRQEMLKQQNIRPDENGTNINKSPPTTKTDKQKVFAETLQSAVGIKIDNQKILAYTKKAPAAPDFHQNPLRIVYSVKTPASQKIGSRYIPSSPERILDAPDIINDYYLNLMDWSNDNIVTVALGQLVYLWNAGTGNIEELREYENGDHACSLSWIQEGHILAIGTNDGTVELWDCVQKKRLRIMDGHSARVGSLAWNSFIVSSGCRDGSIVHHDVRQRDHIVTRVAGHTQEVCGLKWSNDFRYLASGGNDNLVNIWPSLNGSQATGTSLAGQLAGTTTAAAAAATTPVLTFNQHQAAVRALAWCPWQNNVLATGGGTADRCIKFWNINNGTCLNSIDSQSQVCALLWSKNYKELISAHGYANNQLTIWKYPTMIKQAELTGHTSRVLQMAMSPDGSTVMSAAADETLRLWNCFAPDPNQNKKDKKSSVRIPTSIFTQSIR